MKKIVSIACCAIMMALCTTVQAQDNHCDQVKKKSMNPEQMIEKKAQHIARQLALDDATTKKFIETYREYKKEMKALGHKDCCEGKQDLTEAEAEKALKACFDNREQSLSLQKKYYGKYSKFLTQKQIMRVYEMDKPHGQHPGKPGKFGHDMKPGKFGKGMHGKNGKCGEGQHEKCGEGQHEKCGKDQQK